MKHSLIIMILIGIFSLGLCFTLQARDMQWYVEQFKKKAPYAEAYCKGSIGDFEQCMDRQFNCFVELDNVYVSDSVVEKAKRAGTDFDRQGNVKAINYCEIKRKAKLYHAQEKAREMEKNLE